MTIDASVVIPTYNRRHVIKNCLDAVMAQDMDRRKYEVIVVDDGSTDGSYSYFFQFACKQTYPVLRILHQQHKGPAAARNYGIVESDGRIICFLDDDCVPTRQWLSEILMPLQKDDEVMAVKGKVMPVRDNDCEFSQLLEKFIYRSLDSHATNNVAVRKSIFHHIGYFDSSFPFAAWEDTEFFFRFNKTGLKMVSSQSAVVYHRHEENLVSFKRNSIINGYGLYYFVKKYWRKNNNFCRLALKYHCSWTKALFSARYIFRSELNNYDISANHLKIVYDMFTMLGFIKAIIGIGINNRMAKSKK